MTGDIEKGYDLTAVAQAQGTIDNLEQNPLELQMLDMIATKLNDCPGLVCDLGCGPGQIARYFHGRGFQAVGVDLSAGMLKEARKLNPEIRFVKANMKKLPFKNGELAAVVGFYSLCHIPRWEVGSILAELRRTLRPSGLLLLTFHLGKGTFLRTESWGKSVSLQTTLFQTLELQDYLRAAGFKIEGAMERPPDPSGGPRGYLWAVTSGEDADAVIFLRESVLTGSARDVEELLATGLSPDTMLGGYTALHLASGDGRLQVMKLLLRAGAKVDVPCWGGGGTALFVAIQMGQLAAARRLVEAGADVNVTDNLGNSLLHTACNLGRTDIVKWLLHLGLDPWCKNSQAETPGTWAIRAGYGPLAAMMEASRTSREAL